MMGVFKFAQVPTTAQIAIYFKYLPEKICKN